MKLESNPTSALLAILILGFICIWFALLIYLKLRRINQRKKSLSTVYKKMIETVEEDNK